MGSYYGYSWDKNDEWLMYLFPTNSSENTPQLPIIKKSFFWDNINQISPRSSIYTFFAKNLKIPGQLLTVPTINDLKDDSSLKIDLQNQANKLSIDATSLFNIISNNYFGYSLDDSTSVEFAIFFGSNPNLPAVQNKTMIEQKIKTKFDGNLVNIYSFVSTYLKTPGTDTANIDDLVDSSWLKNELTSQTTKIIADANILSSIISNTYFGYEITNQQNPLYLVLFSLEQGKVVLQTQQNIINNLKAMKATAYSNLKENLDGAGTAAATLNPDSWLGSEITSQSTSLGIDAASLYNLIDTNYFGYNFTSDADPLFAILFTGTTSNVKAKTEQEIATQLINTKANAYTLISETINTPGIFVININQLKDGSWLKTELNNQKTNLIASLTNSISKFYDVFKNSFLGESFNPDSFDGAQYVLLFFNSDQDNNLSLGTNPSEVANTFADNLIIQLKENPNFRFPTIAKDELGAIQTNSISEWINTLFIDNNGKITLTGYLANFNNYQKTHHTTKNNLGLILGITIPLALITLGVGGYFMRKKVIQPKKAKNIK